jgi:hypothetical protein
MKRSLALGMLSALAISACAEKDFAPTMRTSSPKMTLQLSATGAPAPSSGAAWLLLAAVFQDPQDTTEVALLSYKYVALKQGTLNVSLPVDLTLCLAANATRGRDGCTMYLGAALLPDTLALSDTSGNVLTKAFDSAFPIGPFEVAPGRAPSIPPIDLSMTRFAVVDWASDEGLRVGGDHTPASLSVGVFSGTAPTAGVASGGGVTLYALTRGGQLVTQNGQTTFQLYPQLAIFQSGQWRRVNGPQLAAVQGSSDYIDVTAISNTEVYMSGTTGLFRFDGTNISRITAVTDTLYSVASTTTTSGAKYVIAGGLNGSVWIGNTQTWTRVPIPGVTSRIDGVCITGPNEAFASSIQAAVVYRWDGTSWSGSQISATGPKSDLQCPAPGQAFVVGNANQPFRWTGTSWQAMPQVPGIAGRNLRWGIVSGSEIYAYGDSAFTNRAWYRFDGTSWTNVSRTRFIYTGGHPWAQPSGGAAYVVSPLGRVERVLSSGVSVLGYQPSLRDVVVNSATSAFVVGWPSLLARWNGAQWQADAPPPDSPANRMMLGVWSDAPTNAWAVGDQSTVLRFTGTSWNLVSDSLRPAAARDNYNAVWGTGADVWAVGDASILHCKATGGCINESVPGTGALLTVWGTSATNVFAAGDNGRILRFNGTSWSSMSSSTSRALARIAGSSGADIYAVGDSVLIHFDGTQWSTAQTQGDFNQSRSHVPTVAERAPTGNSRGMTPMALWVRSAREIYVGSQYGEVVRYDGTGWSSLVNSGFRHRIMGFNGAANGCALVVTEGQFDNPAPTMYRGVSPSGCFSTPMPAPSSWP